MSAGNRRKFVKNLGTIIAAGAAADLSMGAVSYPLLSPGPLQNNAIKQDKTFVGIQMSPHTMLDEG
ncbi:MAG: hypothetical protein R6V34_03205, partial [Bacteroidales bacterium]